MFARLQQSQYAYACVQHCLLASTIFIPQSRKAIEIRKYNLMCMCVCIYHHAPIWSGFTKIKKENESKIVQTINKLNIEQMKQFVCGVRLSYKVDSTTVNLLRD